MTLVPFAARNQINPFSVSTIEQLNAPYGTYDHMEVCRDPNCAVCRAERHGRRHKHHHHHHKRHHRKHKKRFWESFSPRVESASSTVTIHNVHLDERRPYYNSPVRERALVPVDRTERQLMTTNRTQRFRDDDLVREAWTNNPTTDDEIVCCRAYNGCRCPCWCCIILIILFVILLIVLIVLLATLL